MPQGMSNLVRALVQPERTTLDPEEEALFQRWAQASAIQDVDHPASRYDYRGYWKEHGDAPMRFGEDHFTDTYKQHGHPRFSAESKYSRGPMDGGRWLTDDVLIPPPMKSH
jgi:hypothetical protein